MALEQATRQKHEKQEELAKIREDIGKKLVPMEPVYDKKTHWRYLLSEMKWMSNDFDRERKDQRNNGKKLNRACKKKLDEKKQVKVKQRKVSLNSTNFYRKKEWRSRGKPMLFPK